MGFNPFALLYYLVKLPMDFVDGIFRMGLTSLKIADRVTRGMGPLAKAAGDPGFVVCALVCLVLTAAYYIVRLLVIYWWVTLILVSLGGSALLVRRALTEGGRPAEQSAPSHRPPKSHDQSSPRPLAHRCRKCGWILGPDDTDCPFCS